MGFSPPISRKLIAWLGESRRLSAAVPAGARSVPLLRALSRVLPLSLSLSKCGSREVFSKGMCFLGSPAYGFVLFFCLGNSERFVWQRIGSRRFHRFPGSAFDLSCTGGF